MAVTIKHIAREAGVSHSTVSRALSGSRLVSETTRERIQQVALEMGYLPSAAARSLKTNRSQALGVILSHIADPFFSEILQGIDDVAQKHDYSLFIAASQHDPAREQSIVRTMREHRVDGMIICSTSFGAQQSHQLLKYEIPIVVINNQAADEYRYSIYHDDVDGCSRITRHLLGLGHRRIAYLGNSLSGRTTADRLAGFRQEMETAGLAIPADHVHQVAGGGAGDGEAAIAHFIGLPHPPTALVCYNDMMALGALKGLERSGMRVPDDMSVTGFDNIALSGFAHPPLTTFDQPKHFIGAEAARLLLDLLGTASSPEASAQASVRRLKGRLLVRQSTAPPAGS